MKTSAIGPQDQVFWYLHKPEIKQLRGDITVDVAVVGGGMAGLTAAHHFLKKGLKVALLEKNYCGSGASGKSSGFITQDAELSLSDLMRNHGAEEAKKIWEFITSGINIIRHTIETFNLDCDYQVQDTLVVANTKRAFTADIEIEHRARISQNYGSSLYTPDEITKIVGSDQFKGGISYPETFGIHAYRYCFGIKKILEQLGVAIYEESPMIDLQNNRVQTPCGSVKADHIVVCIDRFINQLKGFADKVYQAQTFLMISAPLTQTAVKKIFPDRPFMVWDTDLVYHYYRLTGDNRLLLGGSTLWDTYSDKERFHNTSIVKKLTRYFHTKFPDVSVQFDYIWPGLIGISKDFFPIAGPDASMPSVYYISAAAGLPWAAALGAYAADSILGIDTRFDHCFSPYRSTKIGPLLQTIMGQRCAFALSNFLTVGSI